MPENHDLQHGRSVAVRLEGGIGDHLLGLRILPFVRAAHPDQRIVLYSDAAGSEAQRDLARMSPFADDVRMLGQRPSNVSLDEMGWLSTLAEADQRMLRESAAFYDAWGGNYFLDAAQALDVPVFDILAKIPELRVPEAARERADAELAEHGDCKFIALNLTKYGPDFLDVALEPIRKILASVGTRPEVRILNLYSRNFRYDHWPDDVRRARAEAQQREADLLDQISVTDQRIVSLVDLAIPDLAAVLERCRYFIGVDNGIRHLAWALGLKRTVVMPDKPDAHFALRWCHDYHRSITPEEPVENIERHIETLTQCLSAEPRG